MNAVALASATPVSPFFFTPSGRTVPLAASAPDWTAFVGVTAIVLTLLLALARASQALVRDDTELPGRLSAIESARSEHEGDRESLTLDDPEAALGADDMEPPVRETGHGVPIDPESPGALTADELATDPFEGGQPTSTADATAGAESDAASLSTGQLLANVALTQGLFGALLLAAAWYTRIPASAFGVTSDPLSTGLPAVGVGVALGLALYVANEVGAASADAMGVEYDERLRGMLAPDSTRGWLVLLLVVLPVVAGVEEFIFRAAVVGATSAGFGTSPWALAVVSSVAFALGHGAQGRLGVLVTGSLGLVLAGAFVLTGSFLVVFVAHYLVNALEFVVHELLGIEWVGGERAGDEGS
jgi:membrane protease YdiL (CAAX protease family)